MADFEDCFCEDSSRKDFLCGVAASAATPLLGSAVVGQELSKAPQAKALDDPNITHGKITYRSGADTVDGYLARPKKKGRHPIVIVVPGNQITEEYIPNTAAILAQAGFVGLAVNIFALVPETASTEERRKILDAKITDERIFQDIQAGIDYLRAQPFVRSKGVGITGFCFGGRNALLFSARSKDVKVVVSFYGNVVRVNGVRSSRAVWPMDIVKQIRVPVQGHYVMRDQVIAPADDKRF